MFILKFTYLYFLIGTGISFTLFTVFYRISKTKQLLITAISCTVLTLIIESIIIHNAIDLSSGQNLNAINVIAMVMWLMTTLSLIGTRKHNAFYLLLILLPLNLLAGFSILIPHATLMFETKQNISALVHILSAITAISFMGHAALQSACIYLQDYLLKNHSKAANANIFPPMINMEYMLFLIIALGFVVLSLALFSGFLYLEKTNIQILFSSKSLFAYLAWALFLFLIIGRKVFGWRGRFAAKWVLVAFSVLCLSYGVSKWLP